ncbi:MAG: sensor histidine kinase [Phycisphaerales bacterium]
MPEAAPHPAPNRPAGILAGLKIRKKLMVLHTSFSLSLAILLIFALRPALSKVIIQGEQAQAALAFDLLGPTRDSNTPPIETSSEGDGRITIRSGSPAELGLSQPQAARLLETQAKLPLQPNRDGAGIVLPRPDGSYVMIRVRNDAARGAVNLVYALLIVSLLVGYAFVVIALEAVVLPRHVYGPIRAMLSADDAVRIGDRHAEMISTNLIPADELGEIMRSRNDSIAALRSNENQLADALIRLEDSAGDLRKKNHLLEAARRNLEGADRLASLGMMSAGIAHELNTPLAVVKGLADKIATGQELSTTERALLARVVGRLEKLSEGLLDFARVRPPQLESADLRNIVDEAWTLIRLDRSVSQAASTPAEVINGIDPELSIRCDSARMVQVFVNLVRNAIAVMRESSSSPAKVLITSRSLIREGEDWVNISIVDSGPGIAPDIIERLFEPFYSTRLDSKGTGLGLAVTEGIVREHGGVLIARNATSNDREADPDLVGAVFEILLPTDPAGLFGTIE